MTLVKLPYIQAFMARGRRFYYFRRPGAPRIRLPGLPGSDEFMTAYRAALTDSPRVEIGASRTKSGTINDLIVRYYGSAEFTHVLSEATQKYRRNIIERFRAPRGDRPVNMLEQRHVVAILEQIKRPFVRIGRQHIRNGGIYVKQRKTGVELTLPVLTELAEAIAAMPNEHLTFLVTISGKPFSDAGFGNWFRECCDEAGLKGYSAHGLRKAGCVRLAEAGCTEKEIAAWSGHLTLGEIARYTRAADQKRLAKAASDKLATMDCQTVTSRSVKQEPTS